MEPTPLQRPCKAAAANSGERGVAVGGTATATELLGGAAVPSPRRPSLPSRSNGPADYAVFVHEGIDEESEEQSPRRQAELGRLLAAAEGYRVVAGDATHVGWLDDVRYERHVDHPDEIVVRRRGLFGRQRRAFPFSAVEAVRPRERTVVLRLDVGALERSTRA